MTKLKLKSNKMHEYRIEEPIRDTSPLRAECTDSRLQWYGEVGIIKDCVEEEPGCFYYIIKFGKKLVELHVSQVEVL